MEEIKSKTGIKRLINIIKDLFKIIIIVILGLFITMCINIAITNAKVNNILSNMKENDNRNYKVTEKNADSSQNRVIYNTKNVGYYSIGVRTTKNKFIF